MDSLNNENAEPLVVADIHLVSEDLVPKLMTVRHGYGI